MLVRIINDDDVGEVLYEEEHTEEEVEAINKLLDSVDYFEFNERLFKMSLRAILMSDGTKMGLGVYLYEI